MCKNGASAAAATTGFFGLNFLNLFRIIRPSSVPREVLSKHASCEDYKNGAKKEG